MRHIAVGPQALVVPELALGCMRISQVDADALDRLLATAIELGMNFFDHADVYGGGACETLFAAAVKRLKLPRDSLLLQGKCGIHKDAGGITDAYFDFSREHILASVDGILERLDTDHLDTLLLHRPDALAEPDEVAEAFTRLQNSGKVRHFGVSNHNPGQMALLQRSLPMPLLFNQLQFGVAFTPMIDAGLNVNMQDGPAIVRDSGALDHCRLHGIAVQAWSPFQHGFFEGPFLGNPKFAALNAVIQRVAAGHGVTDTAVAVAWISRHPSRIQTVLGSTSPQRLRDAAQSQGLRLSRAEWYEIYRAAGNRLP